MHITYDKNSDAKYIRFKKGKVARTKEEKKWLFFDCDKSGEVLGIEVLDASKHPISVSTVMGKLVGCQDVGRFGNENTGLIIRNRELKENLQLASYS